MSNPLATIFHGDVTLEQGSDITQFGWGDLNVNRRCVISGTETSTGPLNGALVVYGGVSVSKTSNLNEDVNVLYGITRLTETHIDTSNGPTTVTGGNRVDISVGASSQFVSTGGNLTLTSQTQTVYVSGGRNACNAVDIVATSNDGGISILSGSGQGCVAITSGAGGIQATTSSGNVAIAANNGSGSFVVNSNANNQDLTFSLNGTTDSQLRIESAGNNATRTALVINTNNTNGDIQISNANGLGTGSLTQLVGSGGFSLITNTQGPVSVVSQAAPCSIFVESAGQNQNLTIGLNNASDSSLILQSAGTNATNTAIVIETTHTSGNILLAQPQLSQGMIELSAGSGGLHAETQTGGSITLTTYGATSLYTNATTADYQDLTVSVTGDTNSRVNISSTGTSNEAILLQTTHSGGGVYVAAEGTVQLESNSLQNGVQIATATSGIPVKIGTSNSTTTIYGNLDVKGVTSTIESQVVTVDDNIVVVNNAPSGTSDGGLAIKRFQSANNSGTGDVVLDAPEETGTVRNGDNTLTTVKLDLTANNTNDYYAGWWIKITAGTGANQVRRIKAYEGNTRVATIYSTLEQTTLLENPKPVEGMDFLTIPDTSSTYALFPCHYVMSIWDESSNEFALICSNTNPQEQASIAHYADLHINNLTSNGIFTNMINNSLADITSTVTLNDGSTVPVTMSGFPQTHGVYMVFVKPESNSTRAHAVFMIGRINVSGIPGTVVRLISVKGAQYDHLDIQWPANGYPQLYYRPHPLGGSGSTVYKVKVTSL